MQNDELSTPFIFFLCLDDSLSKAFYVFDEFLKEKGYLLVPVKIDQLQLLVASSEQEQVIVLCSVTDSRECKLYNDKVRGFLKFILKSKRLTFMNLSSFGALNDQRQFFIQKNYFFLRYPLNAKTLSAKIIKYHALKKEQRTIWPGGKKATFSGAV